MTPTCMIPQSEIVDHPVKDHCLVFSRIAGTDWMIELCEAAHEPVVEWEFSQEF